MKVEMRDITKIRPYENNPRINDVAVDAVAKSIQEFGFRQPIVPCKRVRFRVKRDVTRVSVLFGELA